MNPSTAFYHIPESVIKERCIYLHRLLPSERCAFVSQSLCDENANFVSYHYVMFCDISDPSFENPMIWLLIFGMTLFIFVLFLILAITVDEYFCPAIGQLSKMMGLSENLAGVTLLAWGNGAADILSGITNGVRGDTILMFNQILGGAMFVTCIVAGCVVVSRPFYVQPYYFLRDTIFTLCAAIWIETATQDEKITILEACSFLLLYLAYLLVVIVGFLVQEQLQKYVKVKIEEEEVDWGDMGKPLITREVDNEDMKQFQEKLLVGEDDGIEDNEPETVRKLFRDFIISVNPIHRQEWNVMNCWDRFLYIIKAPFVLVLNFLVPVYSPTEKRRGWSKLLNCTQCTYYPAFMLFGIGVHELDVGGLPLILYVGPVGVLLAVVIFFTSQQNRPPPYHCIFAFIALTMGIIIIFTTVKEIVAVLSLFGTLLQITPQTLAITLLAWGNSLGDAVANIKIAKQGFQRMAFAASFAGVLANSLLSMGITFLIKNLQQPVENQTRLGVMGPNCSLFLIINLVFSIMFVLFTKFQARRSYGLFLITIYIEFLLFCILCELELIHPLGTDHEFARDIFHLPKLNNVSGGDI